MAFRAPTSTGFVPYKGYQTWYQIFGTLTGRMHRPLLVVHGGPGAGHNYMLPLQDLAYTHEIPVIMYDQIGCGNSTVLTNKDVGEGFWTMDLYLDEIEAVLAHLGVQEEYDIIGNSFGGMLVVEHALRRPTGLKHLVISCSLATTKSWGVATQIWRDQLPDGGGEVLRKHELEGTMGSAEYAYWTQVFNERHECRVIPMPEYVKKTFELLDENHDANDVMIGPTNVDQTGTLSLWDVRPQLPSLSVPTLVYWGKYDVGQDICTKPFADLIPGARAYKFLQGSHMPHVEQRELHMQLVGDFLLDKTLPETELDVLEKLK